MQHHRRSLIVAFVGGIVFIGAASQASAADKIWSVPGVINNGVATVFSCTNGGTAPASVTVSLFNSNGSAGPTGTATIAVNATADFGTATVAALGTLDVNLGAGTMLSSSARISAPSGVYCTAYVIDRASDPPAVAWSLKVVKKTTQKGD